MQYYVFHLKITGLTVYISENACVTYIYFLLLVIRVGSHFFFIFTEKGATSQNLLGLIEKYCIFVGD